MQCAVPSSLGLGLVRFVADPSDSVSDNFAPAGMRCAVPGSLALGPLVRCAADPLYSVSDNLLPAATSGVKIALGSGN